MFEELNQHRQAVEEQIQKGFEIGFTGNELEKAHNVGDIHPNGKWVWTQLPSGRYDWRVIKKNAGAAPQATANGKKSWDNLSDFYKNGSDERKMWMEWDRFEKTGDPNIISNIRKILEKKFPNVSSWKQYAPNTNNSSKLVAVGADGKEIASIDFGGKGVDLPKLQTFMDACDKVKKESSTSQQQTQWTEKEIADRLPARGAVRVNVGNKRYLLRKVGSKVRVENDYGKSFSSASIRQKVIDAYIEERGISAKPVASSQHPSKKPSSFISKTIQTIKDRFGYGYNRNWTDEKVQKIQDALIENEEVAKKIMGTAFPAAIGSSPMSANKTEIEVGGDTLIFGSYKTIDTTSRNPSFRGSSSNHYFIRRKEGHGGNLASGSSSGRWNTPAEAKSDCKVDALVRYLNISL